MGVNAVGQEESPTPRPTHPAPPRVERQLPPESTVPVTQSEAKEVFKKVVAHLPSLTSKALNAGPDAIPATSKPVTRQEVLAEFDRIYAASKPAFKFTPRPLWYDPSVLALKDRASRKILDHLIHDGFVARVGTIATAKVDTLTPAEFGDSVGYFVARLADLVHMPDTKFTPILEGD